MKMPIIIGTLMLGGSVVAFKGIDMVSPASKAQAVSPNDIALQTNGAGEQCFRYVKPIWASVKRMEPELSKTKQAAAYSLLYYAAKSFCACNEEAFGADRKPSEKYVFGNYAGLHMTMKLTNSRDKRMRSWANERAQKVTSRNQKLIRERPDWFRSMNKTFRQCQDEISLRKKMPSWLKL